MMAVILMKKVELLAPAGDFKALRAAVMSGADAVYLGGNRFGARAFAHNFDDDEMIKAINYAHLYGVKIYVTMNIIVYENEIDDFIDYITFLYKNGVDAIILQDFGMLHLIRNILPELEIHASTQMHIHNEEGVMRLKKLGVKRVVLARETSIEMVRQIKANTGMDIEMFAHGALCISYSGQCLMSSLIGGRSGNRGECQDAAGYHISLFGKIK
jgi:putative protease